MKPVLTVSIVIGFVCLGLLVSGVVLCRLWVGNFPLEVRLVPYADREITGVSFDVPACAESAERGRGDIRKVELDLKPVEPVDGHTFTVRVRCGGCTSAFGWEWSYSQYQLLVLKIDFADGTSLLEIAEI